MYFLSSSSGCGVRCSFFIFLYVYLITYSIQWVNFAYMFHLVVCAQSQSAAQIHCYGRPEACRFIPQTPVFNIDLSYFELSLDHLYIAKCGYECDHFISQIRHFQCHSLKRLFYNYILKQQLMVMLFAFLICHAVIIRSRYCSGWY